MDKRFSEVLRRFHVEPDNGLVLNTIVMLYKASNVEMLDWDNMVLSSYTNDLIKNQEQIDFRKLLVTQEDRSSYDSDHRFYRGIPFNEKISLSVQGSRAHYCTPRRTLKNIYDYSCMEIALVNDGGLIDVGDDIFKTGILKGLPNQEIFESEGTVGPYIDIEVIQGIFDFLRVRVGLRMNDLLTMMSHTV